MQFFLKVVISNPNTISFFLTFTVLILFILSFDSYKPKQIFS